MALDFLEDDDRWRNPVEDRPNGAVVPSGSGGGVKQEQSFNADAEVRRIAQQYGLAPESSDIATLAGKNAEDRAAHIRALEEQAKRRAAPTSHRTQDSQSGQYDTRTHQPIAGTPAFQNTSPQFDDPSMRQIEDYSLDRFRQRTNPDANSGTAIFEKYARELIDTLKQPAYSPQDEAIIKTKASDAIEQERTATKQRWIEQVSAMGHTPSSGVALQGLLQIDNHFNGLRTTVESEFARDAIGATRANRLQVLDTAGQLADSEESRLREAGTYAAMPYGLQQDAFQRNLQLAGMGGSPSQLINSLLSIQQAGQQSDAYRSQNRAAMTSGLLQYLGYLFG